MNTVSRVFSLIAASSVIVACQSTSTSEFVGETGARQFVTITSEGDLSWGRVYDGHTLPTLIYPKHVEGDAVCYGLLGTGCHFAYVRNCRAAFVKVEEGSISSKCIENTSAAKAGYQVYVINPPSRLTAEEVEALEDKNAAGKPNYRVIEFDHSGRLEGFTVIDLENMEAGRYVRVKGSFRFPD